ncbi:hypothetical protein L6R21_28210, partial [bacterium]|nr:hypothetical protein [bacterium]
DGPFRGVFLDDLANKLAPKDRAFDYDPKHGASSPFAPQSGEPMVTTTKVKERGVAKDKRYQTWRYASLLAFQVGFFVIVNLVAVQALSVKYAWRAWGLYQPFPLFFNTFFWWYDGDPAWIVWSFVGAGLVGTFVAIPLLARNHGKRFCTWICGCGGLAETLGDRWRHLSAKGKRSRDWELQGVVVLAASVIVA